MGSVIGGTVRFFGALLSSPLVTPGFFNGRKYSKTIKIQVIIQYNIYTYK